MTSVFAAKFHLPPQDLDAPTLFAPSPDAIAGWLAGLPKTNLGQMTRSLFGAVNELNRVRLAPALRMQLLETLRPSVYFASNGLRRHYLGQPIQLPEQPLKVAHLAHVLHEQLATGYILAAAQTATAGRQSGFSQPQAALATAAHRGIVEHSQNLLRDLQLYRDPHPGCWFTIHQLLKFAREAQVQHAAIADEQSGDSSVEAAYLRAALLGSAKTNQLRQENLDKVFQHALGWVAATTLTDAASAALVIDPTSDDGPIYRQFAKPDNSWYGLDTDHLTQLLNAQAELAEANALSDQQLSADLLLHLAQAWSGGGTRSFARTEVREPVEIAIGLTATHHFVGGEVEFGLLLDDHGGIKSAGQDENPFLRGRLQSTAPQSRTPAAGKDVWDSPYQTNFGSSTLALEILDDTPRVQFQKSGGDERDKFRVQSVERVNVSIGGLCVVWPPLSTLQLRTGEIVGIRENAQKNWSIGAIRWVQLTDAGPTVGIALLSPAGIPYGARVVAKSGEQGEYLRALVLPEIKQIGQATTLIVPRLPFRTGQKVSLLCHGKETRIQLTRKIAGAAAFSQFEFRRLSAAKAETPANTQSATGTEPRESGFDSLWDSL